MRIGFVTWLNCARVTKEAIALKALGHQIHLITHQLRWGGEVYDTITQFLDPNGLRQAVKAFSDKIDLFHYHNTPDWPVIIMRSVTNKKIIMDMHDSQNWFFPPRKADNEPLVWYDENLAIECSDGFIVPSEPCFEELTQRTSKPIVILPPASPLAWYNYEMIGFKGGLCYNGGLVKESNAWNLACRDMTDTFQAMVKNEINIHIYSPNFRDDRDDPLKVHYGKITQNLNKIIEPIVLIKTLGMHSWNLVGNINPHFVLQYSSPNKLYDAIAAGVPSVVINYPDVEKIIGDCGIVVKSIEELKERWDEHLEKRKNLWMKREEMAMESYIGRAIQLYGDVCNS
jgi:glycosyltransferase involved in cell wall biosynthesis